MNPQRARVSSVEAIERFRARLIIYRDKIKPLLADASDEVSRTREWVRADRRNFWENEVRRRKRQLDELRQAHFSARFSKLRPASTAEQAAVHRAEKAFHEAEEKLATVKRWSFAFDQQTGPILKQLEQLRGIVSTDLLKGEDYLGQIIQKLDLYLATVAPRGVSAPPPPVSEAPEGETVSAPKIDQGSGSSSDA